MDLCLVHRINFFTPEPTAIHSLAYDETISRLAVSRIVLPSDKHSSDDGQTDEKNSRVDSSIEIWDVTQSPYLEKKIPSSFTNSVEVLTWCQGRLFSVNRHGTLNEYDLNSLKCKYNISVSSGSPLYSISVNKQKTFLATGNEDGHIVLYHITAYGVEYEKRFDKQEGQILCLDWHKDGDIIVTGSVDTIRIWNVQTGQVINRIIVGREMNRTETIVWCIAITSDMTIISGDSRGKTSFWDGNTGTLISSLQVHKADVLALTLTEDENGVYASGVDPLIVMFNKIEVKSSDRKWIKSIQRLEHTHDVRALQITSGGFLASGGIDCNLVFTKYPPKTVLKFFPLTQVQYCSVASKAAYILLTYPRFIEVWKLGMTLQTEAADGEELPLLRSPQKIMKFSAYQDEIIICSAISSDGKWVAYSSLSKLRIFFVEHDEKSSIPVLHKVVLPDVPIAYNLIFTHDDKLIVYDKSIISVIKCSKEELSVLARFEEQCDPSEAHLFEVSSNDKYFACAYHNGQVVVYDLEELTLYCRLPQYVLQPTALKFDKNSENLIVVYSDRKVIEYDLKAQMFSKWCKNNSFNEFADCSSYPVTNIVFKKQAILFQDEKLICVLKKCIQTSQKKKRIKSVEESSTHNQEINHLGVEMKIVDRYEHISSLHSVQDDLVVVEILPNDIVSALPPPLRIKKYGM